MGNNYNTQPAPSGIPTVPQNVKPHVYKDPSAKEGSRKQLAIDLGVEAGRFVYEQIKSGESYAKHNLTPEERGVFIDFMYAEMYRLLYQDKYPHDETYQVPTSPTNKIGALGGKQI